MKTKEYTTFGILNAQTQRIVMSFQNGNERVYDFKDLNCTDAEAYAILKSEYQRVYDFWHREGTDAQVSVK